MFIDIHQLELRPIEFDEEFRPGVIDFGADVRQHAPLKTQGRADLLREHRGGRLGTIEDIRLVGELATSLELNCARCLDPVVRDISRAFDLLYRPRGVDGGHEELSVTQAEAEIGYYAEDGLLLEDVLREQVLLSVPIKTVCREECKGLCPHCGANLNVESCSCKTEPVDPRWDRLKDFKI